MPLFVCLVSALLGGALGHVMARRGAFVPFGTVTFGAVVGLLACVLQAETHAGEDALAYGMLAMLFLAPGLLGQVTGGVIGLYRRRNSGQRTGP